MKQSGVAAVAHLFGAGHIEFSELGHSLALEDPAFEFLLAIDVDVEVVVEVAEYAGVDHCADEEGEGRGEGVVHFDVERLRARAHDVAEVQLSLTVLTRKKVENRDSPMQ